MAMLKIEGGTERGATSLLTKPLDFALLRHEIDTRLEQAA